MEKPVPLVIVCPNPMRISCLRYPIAKYSDMTFETRSAAFA